METVTKTKSHYATKDDVLDASRAIYDGVKSLVDSKSADWEVNHGVKMMRVIESNLYKNLDGVVAQRVKMALDLKVKELEEQNQKRLDEYEKRLESLQFAYEKSLEQIKTLVEAATKPKTIIKKIEYDEYGRPSQIQEG